MDLQRDNLGFMLSDVWRLIRRVFDEALKGSGLTLAQARALLYISTHQGIRQVELPQQHCDCSGRHHRGQSFQDDGIRSNQLRLAALH